MGWTAGPSGSSGQSWRDAETGDLAPEGAEGRAGPEHIVYLLVCSFILALIFEAPLGTSFPSCSPINAHFRSSISFP